MLITLSQVFDQAKLENIREFLSRLKFADGKLSAGDNARKVKSNEELHAGRQQQDYLDQLIMSTLANNEDFRDAVLPLQVSQPVIARYKSGMSYGKHIDDPVMGAAGGKFRADIALTIFLNAPDEYTGGELIIQTTFGEQQIKLPAGDIVIYPASSIHRVTEVTSGERLVAVLWIQSMIRDPAKRELLYTLSRSRNQLMKEFPDHNATQQVDQVYVNLVRMWGEI